MSDVALEAIRKMAVAVDAMFFDGRLRARTLRIEWLPDNATALATCWPEQRKIAFWPDTLDARYRRRIVALVVHELAHLATRNEWDHHGLRWHRVMRRCGMDPNGTIIPGGPMDSWLRQRGL